MKGGDVLHHVRRLRALIDREPRFGGVPVRHDRARLQRHAGVTAEDELRFHDLIGIGKRLIDGAGIETALESKIIAQRSMNNRRLRIERGAHVRHRLEFFIFDAHGFGGVLGNGAAGRHDGRDGFALPADAIDRDRMLRRRFEALQMREHADPGRDDGGELLAGHDGDDAGHLRAALASIVDDLRVGMGRTQEHHMRHPRQFHVADIEPAPLHQPLEVGPRDHLADIGIRPIELRKDFRHWLTCAVMTCAPCAPRRGLDRVDDGLVAGAAAVIAGEMLADPLAGPARPRCFKQILRGHQHSGRAIAALQRVAVAKSGLQIGDLAAVGQPLDGLNGRAVRLHRQHQAGTNDLAIDAHRARAANAVLAADMGSGQLQMLAQEVRKIEPRQNVRIDALAVDMRARLTSEPSRKLPRHRVRDGRAARTRNAPTALLPDAGASRQMPVDLRGDQALRPAPSMPPTTPPA